MGSALFHCSSTEIPRLGQKLRIRSIGRAAGIGEEEFRATHITVLRWRGLCRYLRVQRRASLCGGAADILPGGLRTLDKC